MTDLQTLHDAFTELERRADAVVPAARPQPHRARGFRLVPMVATMAAVAALAAGAVWVAPDDQAGTVGTAPPPTIALTQEELSARFQAVLGETGTFEVTSTREITVGVDHHDAVGREIAGTLTVDGVTGTFELKIYAFRADLLSCGPTTCEVRPGRYSGGGVAIIGIAPSPISTITYEAQGWLNEHISFTLLVSNLRDPDDPNSEVLAPQPPLSTDQLWVIGESDRW